MDRATERALVALASDAVPRAGADGDAVVYVERVAESRDVVRWPGGRRTVAFHDEAVAVAERQLTDLGGGVLKYREVGEEWRTIRRPGMASRPHSARSRTPVQQPPTAADTTAPTAVAPAPTAVTSAPTAVNPVQQPKDPTPAPDPDAVAKLTVRVSDIPDVLESDEMSFVLQGARLRRPHLEVAGHRLRRAGTELIGIESPVSAGLWSRSYVLETTASVWLVASLEDLMSPIWTWYAKDPNAVTQFSTLCPLIMQSLRTNTITVTIEGRSLPIDIEHQDGARTIVGAGFSEPVAPVLSGRVLALADLVAQVALQLTGEVIALATLRPESTVAKVDWLKRIGEGADTAKKVLDFLATLQKLITN